VGNVYLFRKQGRNTTCRGLNLVFPPGIEQHAGIEKSLIEVVKIADPLVKVTYGDQPRQQGLHLVIGRKRRKIAGP
jgi:hypothetical protein